ncbi:MAG: diacylglycerol kinase family lipid kinase [Chloroflexota bacterium]|nr:diacylglycerol kinase family lipid kinase [Chloroflexota bacterium]
MESGPTIGVILNPRANAGRAIQVLPRLADALAAAEHCYQIHVTTAPGDASVAARRFAGQGIELILAVGGDGTINEVANGLLEHGGTRLGIVPAGRGADFMRTLAPSYRPLSDVAALAAAMPRRVDLGLATFADGACRAFVNVAGVGFDAEVARRTARSRLPGRHTPYLAGLATALLGYRNRDMTVTIDGERVAGPMRAVLVANGQFFGGGFRIVPAAAIDDGVLDVAIIGDIGRLDLVRTVPRLYRGQHTAHRAFRHLPARSVRVETAATARVELDGELAGYAPVTFTVVPGALLVVA